MARPAKSLVALVNDRTFSARRHHDRLEGHVLPWPELAAIQARYVATSHELERRQIALEFERAVRGGFGPGADRRDGFASLLDAGVVGPSELVELSTGRSSGPDRLSRANFARELYDASFPLEEIAQRLGVANGTVRGYLREFAKAA